MRQSTGMREQITVRALWRRWRLRPQDWEVIVSRRAAPGSKLFRFLFGADGTSIS